MATPALAFAVLPGKSDELRALIGIMAGERKAGFDATERRNGFTREHLFLQATDPGAALAHFGRSQGAFDVWQKGRIQEVCGIDVGQPPEGPPPELLLAWPAG